MIPSKDELSMDLEIHESNEDLSHGVKKKEGHLDLIESRR